MEFEQYVFAESIEQAVDVLAGWGRRARIIAGGTDLMLETSRGLRDAECFVDITRIPALDRIEIDAEWVTVGAAVTFAQVQADEFLARRVPALVGAAAAVGTGAIQAVATWAGNIAQAMPAADGGIVAVALDVEARLVDAQGARWLPVESLYAGPKASALDSAREVISHLRFRVPGAGWGCAFGRVSRRPSLVLPILNCAATLRLSADGATIASASLALGPVAALPFRARVAESALVGQPLTADTFARAAAVARDECDPHSNPLRASREYRQMLIPVLVQDTLGRAAEQAVVSLP